MHGHVEYENHLEILAVLGPFNRVKKQKDDLQRLKSVASIGFFIIDQKVNQGFEKEKKKRIMDSKP